MRRLLTGFTTRASCLLAAGLTALLCGIVLGEIDLVRAGVLAVAVPVVAAIVVQRSRVTISSHREAEPLRSGPDGRVSIHLVVTNRSVLPSGPLMLEDRLPDRLSGKARFSLDGLAGRETRTVAYQLPSLPRGRYRAGPLRMRVIDPFGMIDITRSFTATSDFMITPIVDRLPDAHLPVSFDAGENAGSHSIGSHGADDASTREYRMGDDLRKIHWRSTARTGALMVRHEERPWQGNTTLLLDTRAGAHASAPDLPAAREAHSLEWAISAAASIGAHLSASGRDLSVIDSLSSPDRWRPPTFDSFIDRLSELRPATAPDLSPVSGQLRPAGRDSTLIAVLGRLDPISIRTLAEAHPRGSAVPAFAILLDVATWGRDEPADGLSAEWYAGAGALRGAGWVVVPAERGSDVAAVWLTLLGSRGSNTNARFAAGLRR